MSMIRKLLVAAVLAGSLSAAHAQYNGTWSGAGPGQNWSTGNNWYIGTPPGPFDRVYFEDYYFAGWTNTVGAVNNVVDVSTAVGALYYSAYAKSPNNHYYTTLIPGGVTLTVGGAFGGTAPTFAVGDIPGEAGWFPNGYANYTTITGAGTLFVNDLAGKISVGGSSSSSTAIPGTILDMTNLYAFTANVAYFYQAVTLDNPYPNSPGGQVFMARTNNLTTIADGGLAPGFLLGSATAVLANPTPGLVNHVLGTVNNYNVDAMVVGGAGSTNFVNLGFTNCNISTIGVTRFLGNSGTFKLRGSSAPRAAIFSIADQSAKPGTMQATTAPPTGGSTATADFRNGTVDILVDKLIVGHGPADSPNPRGDVNVGTLRYDKGTIDANNVYVGYLQGANACSAVGNVYLTSNAVMNVNYNYYMGYVPDRVTGFSANSSNYVMDSAVLTIGGNLQHNDGAFLQTNSTSTLTLGGGTINMVNNGLVSLYNLVGFGTLTNATSISISNSMTVGIPGVQEVGNLTLGNNVTMLGAFPLTFDIGTVTNKGAPYNDYVNILGNVSFNSNQVFVTYNGLPQVGTYTLMNYSGTLSGSLQFTNTTRSAVSLNTNVPGRIALVVSNWTPGNLIWNGFNGGALPVWSTATTAGGTTNWGQPTNQTFLVFDNVIFNDSVTNIGGNTVYTNVCYPSGVIFPGNIYITNTGTLNLTYNVGPDVGGAFRGACGVTKDGAGLLNWGVGWLTNMFTGDFRINNGRVVTFDASAANNDNRRFAILGLGNIFVTNGATLDVSKMAAGVGNPLYLSGSGFPGQDGAFLGNQQSPGYYLKPRLTGDTTISTLLGNVGIAGNFNPAVATAVSVPVFKGELSLNGYNLTVQGPNSKFFILTDVDATTSGGNITVLGTRLKLTRSTISGGGTITFTNMGLLDFAANSAPTNSVVMNNIVGTNLIITVETNASLFAAVPTGTNRITGQVAVDQSEPVTGIFTRGLYLSNALQCLQFDGPITGNAQLTKVGSGPVILATNNSYLGDTFVNAGSLVLGPYGTIPSTNVILNPMAPTPKFLPFGVYVTTLDVSAASFALGSGKTLALNGNVPADLSVKGNVTLSSGSVLFGVGTFTGNLTAAAGSEIAPGGTNNQGQFIVNGNLALNGAHLTWDMTPSFASGDGIVVNGNLDISTTAGYTNVWTIDSIGGFSSDGTNTLITYTGSLTTNAAGALTGLALYNPNVRFVQTLIDPTLTPGKIQVVLTAPPGNLTWTGTDATHPTWWDIKTTTNWINAATNDIFASADFVTFDASGVVKTIDLGAVGPSLKPLSPGTIVVQGASYTFQGTNGLITSSLMVSNGAALVVSNRQDNQIVGFGTYVTAGSTLTFSQATNAALYSDLYGGGVFNKSGSTNRLKVIGDASGWFGSINVTAGQLAAGQSNAISGPVAVSAGATLDIAGQAIPGAVITAVGAGVDGMGAINNRLNVSTNLVGLQSNVVNSLTLVGNTTIGAISNAWGITNLTGGGFNLVKTNANDVWIMTGTDTGLGDVTVGQGRLIFAAAGTGLGTTNKTITVNTGATLGFAATNITSTALIFDAQRPAAYYPTFKNLIFNSANFQMVGLFGSFISTSIFSGPITFTNDLNLILDNNTVSTLYGNITGPPASATPNFGSLIVSATGFTVLNMFGTNSYASNTWVKSGWINISNQINIPTNTALILSNSAAPTLPIQLTLLGGGEFTNRTLRLSSSNMAVTVQGDARWWGNLYLHGNLGFNLLPSTNGGLDFAFTNIDTTSGVGGPFRIGANSTRIRGSLKLKVSPGTTTPSGTMEIGYTNGPATVQFDSTNNWLTTTLTQGRINWGTNDVLPWGASLVVRGNPANCLMDLHGYSQSIGIIREPSATFTYTNAVFNDSPDTDSTLTLINASYSSTNSVTNCTTLMLLDTTNTPTGMKLNLTMAGGLTELLNTNTYTGPTLVTGGKLLLGSYTTNSTVFSGTLSGTPYLAISGSGVFGGNGYVGCPVTNNAGGTLLPGECLAFASSGASLPPVVLTRTGPLTLGNKPLALNAGSTTLFNVDNATNIVTGVGTNATIVGLSAVTYGGTLVVSNVSSVAFTNGQVIKLFDAAPGNYNGAFSSVLVWGALNGTAVNTNSLATNGTIQIVTAVSTTPFKIGLARPNKNTLSLSWPADHLGWRLQILTNSLGTGMLTNSYVFITNQFLPIPNGTNITTNVVQLGNWVNCDNGQNMTSTNVTIGATNVVFRLTYP